MVSGDDEDAINIWDTIKSITIKKFEFKNVLSLDVLPNGLLASGGHGLAIWNITSKKKIELEFNWLIICLVVLPDDFVAISANTWLKIYFIIIFDISTGQINKTLTGHTSFVTHLTILSNNSLASASLDKTMRIWDIEKQLTIKILIGHNNYVNYLVVLPNGLLASASEDSTIKIWNISTIKNETNNNILYPSIKLTGHGTSNKVFSSLVLLNDGSLASGDENEIIIWNITNNGKIIKKLNDSTIGLVVLPDGLLVSRDYREIKVWNITSGLKINTLNDHPDLIKTKNGLVVIDSYLENYFNITSTTDIFELIGHDVKSQSYFAVKSVLSLVILPDKSLISGSSEDIIIWNITTKEKIRIIDDEYFMRYLVNLDDGSFAGSPLEKIKVWNITNGKLIRALIGHTMEVVSLAVISNGLLASASWDTTIRVRDATKGETRMILIGHNYPIVCLKALPNGLLASGSIRAEIKIWNVLANIPTTTTTTTTTTSTTIATSTSTTITINKKDFTSTQFIPIYALYIIICLLVCLIGLIFISILEFI